GALFLEFAQELALPLVELLRRLNRHLHIHVATALGAQDRHAFSGEAEAFAGLGAFGHLHAGTAAVERRHLELAAKRGRHHADGHAAIEIGAFALKDGVRLDREENVEVARRTAAHAGLAFRREPDAGA